MSGEVPRQLVFSQPNEVEVMRNRRKEHGSPGGATLLERLLALVREGGVRSIEEVAQELGSSPVLVEAMLEDLARRGYLHRVEAQCARQCAGCAQAGRCAVAGAGRVWQAEPPGEA